MVFAKPITIFCAFDNIDSFCPMSAHCCGVSASIFRMVFNAACCAKTAVMAFLNTTNCAGACGFEVVLALGNDLTAGRLGRADEASIGARSIKFRKRAAPQVIMPQSR